MASRAVVAPVCAGLSSIVAGLTTYGDAILFHICATLARLSGAAAAAADESAELRFSVLCTTIMSLVGYPLSLYFARREVLRCLPYGLTMATTGLAMVPVGASLLFSGDLGGVKVATGVFFACFAVHYLTLSFREEAVERLRGEPPLPPPGNGGERDPLPQRAPAAAAALAPRAGPLAPLACAANWVDRTLLPLSSGMRPSTALFVLLFAGAGAGFLNGLLGTGGPPAMLAWAVIGAHKDLVRGSSSVYASLEVPLRVFVTASNPEWNPARDGATYAAVGASSVVAFLAGTWLRRFCDTRAILRVMLLVVGLSSSILMGALQSSAVAGGCAAGAAAVGAWLLALRVAPASVARLCCLGARGGKEGTGGGAAASVTDRDDVGLKEWQG
jgi:hypothetical protein